MFYLMLDAVQAQPLMMLHGLNQVLQCLRRKCWGKARVYWQDENWKWGFVCLVQMVDFGDKHSFDCSALWDKHVWPCPQRVQEPLHYAQEHVLVLIWTETVKTVDDPGKDLHYVQSVEVLWSLKRLGCWVGATQHGFVCGQQSLCYELFYSHCLRHAV